MAQHLRIRAVEVRPAVSEEMGYDGRRRSLKWDKSRSRLVTCNALILGPEEDEAIKLVRRDRDDVCFESEL